MQSVFRQFDVCLHSVIFAQVTGRKKYCKYWTTRYKTVAKLELYKALNGLIGPWKCGYSSCAGFVWPVVMGPSAIIFHGAQNH